uniref:VAN3-binding protein n=1 Tax=Quercus lobata TaxID=97700 RepID=A0A7N2MJ38_QUELO
MHSHENCSLGEHEVKLHDNLTSGEHEEEKMEETKGHATLSNRSTSSSKVDNIWKWLTLDKSVQPVVQTRKSFITSLFRRRVKTKEEDRLRTANVHAALSVTRLAAAIAGFAANSTKDKEEANKDVKHISSEGKVDWDQNMSNIVASAAALIATICAESAESIGANRGHVASAVNSGLATQTPADMMTLTATAATCGMRGAAMLKSRAMEYDNLARKLLEVEAQLPVVTPSGHKRHRRISIYSKHKQLILNLEKKYLGVLTTSKKYKIIHVKEEEAHGNFSISLKSNCGDIKLWFEDKNQSLLWISVISNLLQMHNTC